MEYVRVFLVLILDFSIDFGILPGALMPTCPVFGDNLFTVSTSVWGVVGSVRPTVLVVLCPGRLPHHPHK